MSRKPSDRRYLLGLTVGALGVVYGDIGTSPLYALQQCFSAGHVQPTAANVLGVLSLMIWSLVLIVCVKYVTFVLRADNRGEGGILALMTLAAGDDRRAKKKVNSVLLVCGVFGAALLYGDGMITPCITVMGAIEGLHVATTKFDPFIVPITIGLLFALFAFQRAGTGSVGKVFGPVMLLWFLTIAVLGVSGIVRAPQVLYAFSPAYSLQFVQQNGFPAFLVIGAVFLCVTGAEALYADLGHFGQKPIRLAWFLVVFPALVLNYLGQGGLLLQQPAAVDNPFYKLAPSVWLYPLVLLSTVASAIASQALISGAFSITMQAIQLGYLPRMEIRHTSSRERGQIYLPYVNWVLMLCCIGLVLGFKSSNDLGAAYGIAVTLTMLITSVLYYFAAVRVWGWPRWRAGLLCALFIAVELVFFGANALKILQGGWFPLLVAAAIYAIMSTWKLGRRLLGERLAASMLPLDGFLDSLRRGGAVRVRGTAIYMAGNPQGTPLALLHNLKHNKVIHERVVLLTILTADEPHVGSDKRVTVEQLPEGFCRVIAYYGFMQRPEIGDVLQCAQSQGLEIRRNETTFFLSRETVLPAERTRMAEWRSQLFAFLSRNAQPATAYFDLPIDRVVELGVQIEF